MRARLLIAAGLVGILGIAQTARCGTTVWYGFLKCEDLGTSIRVIKGSWPTSNFTIPETLNGKPVTAIGDEAFYSFSGLRSVIIPSTVTSIGRSAFKNCRRLPSITIPSGVTVIEPETFSGCNELKTVQLHPGITRIGAGAFEGCGLTSFETPPKVTVFTERMLAGCDLQNVTIPRHVTRVEKAAVSGTQARSIVIPGHVDFDPDFAFAFSPNLQSVTIHADWTRIGGSMFEGCSSLRRLSAPASVLGVGDRAFADSGLESVKLPSVRTIGRQAFANCRHLATVPLPKGLRSIGDYAFSGCETLLGLHFSGNAPEMGSGMFMRANQATVFYVEENLTGFTYPRWQGRSVSLPRGEIDLYDDSGPLDTQGKALLRAGTIRVGTSSVPQVIFVRNTGNRPLTGVRASVVGSAARDFIIRTAPPSVIQPGQSVRVGIVFKPVKAMSRQAKLVVKSADLDEGLIEVSMSGTGVTLL